jgi:hypothetical protein
MGVLVIKCPTTGRELTTGIQTDATNFARMPNAVAAQARCPHCHSAHSWRPLDARLVDALPPADRIENIRLGDT